MGNQTIMDKITFQEHKEKTVEDLDALCEMIQEVKKSVSEGNMSAFETFFIEGGTPEGDAKISELNQRLVLRFIVRGDNVQV